MELKALHPELQTFQVPSIKSILASENGVSPYPYNKSYHEMEESTACFIHSSGTTGKS